MPLFWFNIFLDARAEVREKIPLGEDWRHYNLFLNWIDPYSFQHRISVSPQNLIKAFESNLKQFAPPPPMMKLRRLIVRFSKFLLGRPFSVKLRPFGLCLVYCPTVCATPILVMGSIIGQFPLHNGVLSVVKRYL